MRSPLLLVVVVVYSLTSFSKVEPLSSADEIVCKKMWAFKVPKGQAPEACYIQSRKFLESIGIKIMLGSYEAYFARGSVYNSEKKCISLLRSIVDLTTWQKNEHSDVKILFENSGREDSLNRAYYTYETCMDYKAQLDRENGTSAATGTTSVKGASKKSGGVN